MNEIDPEDSGPIDYLVVEFPADRRPDGSALAILRELVEQGTVRVLDLVFLRKETDGSVVAIDVVDILQKGRFELDGVQARLESERRSEPPRYVRRVTLHFVVTGDVPADRVKRAIELSRERYCSVLHSLRSDIDFQSSFEILPRPGI